jgi:NAD(P)-dependent dehydrogenase (short-subunit alcohol dehydrogenase family)
VLTIAVIQRTPEGWEMTFATNHFGHFALGLHDALATAGGAWIVSLSSARHRRSPVIFNEINFTSRPYNPGWPTDIPRPPTSSLPSRRHAAGAATASPPTRSNQGRSRPPA